MPTPPVHRSFERLKAIDLSFRLAVAPGLSDRISQGVDVSVLLVGEVANFVIPNSQAEMAPENGPAWKSSRSIRTAQGRIAARTITRFECLSK